MRNSKPTFFVDFHPRLLHVGATPSETPTTPAPVGVMPASIKLRTTRPARATPVASDPAARSPARGDYTLAQQPPGRERKVRILQCERRSRWNAC